MGSSLSSLTEENVSEERPVMDEDEVKRICARLKKYVENCDYDDIEKMGDYLGDFGFPPEAASHMQKIMSAIAELDYDELSELL